MRSAIFLSSSPFVFVSLQLNNILRILENKICRFICEEGEFHSHILGFDYNDYNDRKGAIELIPPSDIASREKTELYCLTKEGMTKKNQIRNFNH